MSPFLYQMIHVAGRTPRWLDLHLAHLQQDEMTLYGHVSNLDWAAVGARIVALLEEGRYPKERSTSLRLELSPEGELSYRFDEGGLYQGYVLRALRPVGHLCRFAIPWEGVRSSAELAAWELAEATVGQGVVIRCNEQGHLLEADHAPLFAVYGRTIYTSREPQGVAGELAQRAIQKAGYRLQIEPVCEEHLPLLDELFYVDHRGVTALERCDEGGLLMSAFAKRVAEQMELLVP